MQNLAICFPSNIAFSWYVIFLSPLHFVFLLVEEENCLKHTVHDGHVSQ